MHKLRLALWRSSLQLKFDAIHTSYLTYNMSACIIFIVGAVQKSSFFQFLLSFLQNVIGNGRNVKSRHNEKKMSWSFDVGKVKGKAY